MTRAQDASPQIHARNPRDSLGCALTALGPRQDWIGADFAAYRKVHAGGPASRVETPSSDRGILIGVALSCGHRRRILAGRRAAVCGFEPDSCYIRSFQDPYRADIETGFDFLLLEFSQGALARSLAECGLAGTQGLACAPGTRDAALAHLARALLPALSAPAPATAPFVEQVVCAMQTHVVTRYHGGTARTAVRGRALSAAQVARAKELLSARMDEPVLIAGIAAQCDASRSQFIRGFKEATGTTPYRWLINLRVERASHLVLHSDLPLADVAICCGFADQSHMTRTFTRLTGVAPGAFRRRQ